MLRRDGLGCAGGETFCRITRGGDTGCVGWLGRACEGGACRTGLGMLAALPASEGRMIRAGAAWFEGTTETLGPGEGEAEGVRTGEGPIWDSSIFRSRRLRTTIPLSAVLEEGAE